MIGLNLGNDSIIFKCRADIAKILNGLLQPWLIANGIFIEDLSFWDVN